MMKNRAKIFVSYAINNLINSKVSINLQFKKRIEYTETVKSSGYFQDEPLRFAVAMNKPECQWLPIFIHQYCHFQQWRQGSNNPFFQGQDQWQIFDKWLDNKIQVNKKDVKKMVIIIRNCELDCQKRVIQKIKQFDLDINIQQYIKTANSYLMFYNAIQQTRKWYIKPPYQTPQIIETMPEIFLKNYDQKKANSKYLKLVKKYCY